MAESRVRLVIDSQEFDAKLKTASQNLNAYLDRVKKGGGDFNYLDDGVMDCVKAIGQLETKSTSAKGSIAELTRSFTEMSMRYKQFTDEEKATPLGVEMSKQLDQLKARIDTTKADLADVQKEIGGEGGGGLTGALDQLAGKFGLNIQQLAGWGAAIGAAKVALDVAKDAFFASEATVDEWGRIMDSNKSLYEGFLTALNTGDISGYLSRIDEIVSAARTAYNELDRLGTMKTIQAPQMSAQQTENDRIRQMIQTGHYIAPLDGRKPAPGMKDGQLLTPEQIRRLEQQLQNGMKTVVGLIGNEVKQTGKAIDAVYERQAKELGMSLSEFRKGTSSMAEFDKRMQDYQRYLDYENEHSTLIRTSYGTRTVRDNTANPYEGAQKWATFRVDGDRYNELVQLILQRDQQAAQAYGMQSQAYRAINRAEGITTRSLLGGGSGGGTTGGSGTSTAKELGPMQQVQKEISALSEEALTADEGRLEIIKKEIAALQEQVRVYQSIQDYAQGKEPDWSKLVVVGDRKAFEAEQRKRLEEEFGTPSRLESMQYSVMKEIKAEDINVDTETLHTIIKDALQNGIDTTSLDLTPIAEQIGQGVDVKDEKWQAILDKYNELRAAIGEEPIQINFDTGKMADAGKATEFAWKDAAGAVKMVGSALSNIQDPAVKVASTIAMAIANIALAYSDTLAKDISSKTNIFAFIGSAAAAMASMVATIATIHSSTGFAEGGIVPGNSYSGDNLHTVDYGINAGELILNRAQQSTIAEALTTNDNQWGGQSAPYVTGEKIVLGINNWGKATGKGQLVFSRG